MKNPARRNINFAVQNRGHHSLHLIIALVVIVSLANLMLGCSNNPMLVRVIYERFPNHISSELSALADFDQRQLDWIKNASTHHHNWHRTTQLPLYVALINGLAKQVQNDKSLNLNYVDSLIIESHALLVQINQCNPARFASLEFKQFADQQVDQIRRNLQRKVNNDKKQYTSNSREQRSQKRFNKIKKLFSYAKLNLNDFQQKLLRHTIDQQVSLGTRRFELTELWNLKFISILQDRSDEGFTELAQAHIAKRWQLIQAAEPEVWAQTRRNWRNFAAALMESLTDKQRKEFGAWLSQMGRTLNTLANEKLQKAKVPSPLPITCSSQA